MKNGCYDGVMATENTTGNAGKGNPASNDPHARVKGGEQVVRKLTPTEREIYGGACIRAAIILPPFRDAIALLNPFFDSSSGTAYTDPYARVGLSPWFFDDLDGYQRASVVLHECMHVLYNHFARGDSLLGQEKNKNVQGLFNLAGDFEINGALDTVPSVDISSGVLPDKAPFDFPRHLSMEQYYGLLRDKADELADEIREQMEKADGQGGQGGQDNQNGQSDEEGEGNEGSGSGQDGESQDGDASGSGSGGAGQQGEGSANSGGSGGQQTDANSEGEGEGSGDGEDKRNPGKNHVCDTPTPERSTAADEAGVERASGAEQSIAQRNTMVRMRDARNNSKGMGGGALDKFLDIAMLRMDPPRVSWKDVLRRALAKSNAAAVRGRDDHSYRRVNRRFSSGRYIFPGTVKYQPTTVVAIDTSGSMSGEDFRHALSEVSGIVKHASKAKDAVRFFSVDTKAGKSMPVNKVEDIKLTGGGGTDMAAALNTINEMKKDFPDIFVLCTDGYVPWDSYMRAYHEIKRPFRHLILVTEEGGYKTVPQEVRDVAMVIDISGH